MPNSRWILFLKSIEGRRFHGETFPVFFPNLGPDVYAAFYGAVTWIWRGNLLVSPAVSMSWEDVEACHLIGTTYISRKLKNLPDMPWSAVRVRPWSVIPICTLAWIAWLPGAIPNNCVST